jgi:hypothetical protein
MTNLTEGRPKVQLQLEQRYRQAAIHRMVCQAAEITGEEKRCRHFLEIKYFMKVLSIVENHCLILPAFAGDAVNAQSLMG